MEKSPRNYIPQAIWCPEDITLLLLSRGGNRWHGFIHEPLPLRDTGANSPNPSYKTSHVLTQVLSGILFIYIYIYIYRYKHTQTSAQFWTSAIHLPFFFPFFYIFTKLTEKGKKFKESLREEAASWRWKISSEVLVHTENAALSCQRYRSKSRPGNLHGGPSSELIKINLTSLLLKQLEFAWY